VNFDLNSINVILPLLLQGLKVTVIASTGAVIVAIALGLLIAIVRRSAGRALRLAIDSVVTVVRSTPLLVQLYLLFYVLPLYGPAMSPMTTGILGLGIHYCAYLSEVFRAGTDAVPKGQWEAAIALQFNRFQTWRRLIIPQVVRIVLPQVGNYFISIYKHSSLLATITVWRERRNCQHEQPNHTRR
jgi:polar amino acid transport system permease protein